MKTALIDRWMSDANFRTSFRSNPAQAVQDAGIEASPQEIAALADMSDSEACRGGHFLRSRTQKGASAYIANIC